MGFPLGKTIANTVGQADLESLIPAAAQRPVHLYLGQQLVFFGLHKLHFGLQGLPLCQKHLDIFHSCGLEQTRGKVNGLGQGLHLTVFQFIALFQIVDIGQLVGHFDISIQNGLFIFLHRLQLPVRSI